MTNVMYENFEKRETNWRLDYKRAWFDPREPDNCSFCEDPHL